MLIFYQLMKQKEQPSTVPRNRSGKEEMDVDDESVLDNDDLKQGLVGKKHDTSKGKNNLTNTKQCWNMMLINDNARNRTKTWH